MSRTAGLGLGMALLATMLLGGCVSHARQENRLPMVVGIVNLDRVLPELPEYREYSEEYLRERSTLFKGLKPGQDMKAFLTKPKQQEIEQSYQKWDEKKRKFLDQTMDKVRVAAQQVSREKRIDIVIVNAPWYPVSERMAVDITTDIIIALKEAGKTVH